MAFKTATLTTDSPTATLIPDADTIIVQTVGDYKGATLLLELSRTAGASTWSEIVVEYDIRKNINLQDCAMNMVIPSGWSIKATLVGAPTGVSVVFELV
jgi:hypothetical protein